MTATTGFDLEKILEKLPNEGFLALHIAFGDGVDCDAFVSLLLEECVKNDRSLKDPEKSRDLSQVIGQLFSIIDVNNNGMVSWEEFSHYIMYAVQAPEVSEKKEIVQQIAFDYAGRCSIESTRLRSAQVDFSKIWDKYILLECGASSSRLALYSRNVTGAEIPLRTYAEYKTSTMFESIAFVDTLRAVAATTTSGKLCMFTVSDDPVLEESGRMQRLTKFREHHLEGRHPVLRYDPETTFLFAGSRDGIVTIINPEDDTRVVPSIVQQVRLHRQPIADLCVLPERGNKKLLTTALDGKIQMYDVIRSEFYGELGNNISAHAMSFCDEYSVLVTCSHKDMDPLLWAPHAVSNVYVGRLESSRPGQRSRLISAVCPKGTPYCFTADIQGQIKLWDLRKLKQVVSFYGDGDTVKNDMSPQLTLRSLAADPRSLDVLSFCRSEFGNGLEFCRSKLVSSRNPQLTHDDVVTGFSSSMVDHPWLFTSSSDCVKIWNARLGEVEHHFKNILPEDEQISSMTTDSRGRRIYLGTRSGIVTAVSSTTCGSLGDCCRHRGPVTAVVLVDDVLFSFCSTDGAINASDVSGDSPVFLFACRRDVEARGTCMDVSRGLSCVVTGFDNGCLEFNDCAEHSHGACMGSVRPMQNTTVASGTDHDEISDYMLPKAAEITAVKICAPRAFVCYGDTRGSLSIVATRPHPKAMTRMSWWKTFFPKSTSTFFAVALSIDWKEESRSLIVGDDQGNLTVWDCAEVLQRYCFVPCKFPAPMHDLLSLPKPTEEPMVYAPRLRGYFTVSPTLTPIRLLRILNQDIFCVVDEKSVYFANFSGDVCGTLMQGRGTILSSSCEPFQDIFGKSSSSESSPKLQNDATEIVEDQQDNNELTQASSSLRKGNESIFVSMKLEIYEATWKSNGLSDNQKLSVSSKLTVQDDAAFNAATPTSSPLAHFRLGNRVLTKFPQPIHSLSMFDDNAEGPGSYYTPLKSTIARDSSPFAVKKSLASEIASTHQTCSISEVIKRLNSMLDGVTVAPGNVIVAARPQPPPLRHPTIAAVFSTDHSSTQDWKARLLQHAHHVRWIQQSVTTFEHVAIAAPVHQLSVAKLSEIKHAAAVDNNDVYFVHPSIAQPTTTRTSSGGKRYVSRHLAPRVTPTPRSIKPEMASELQNDHKPTTFTDFVMPRGEALDHERSSILARVNDRINDELAKRKSTRNVNDVSQSTEKSSALRAARRLSIDNATSLSSEDQGILSRRPPTPTFHYGQSKLLDEVMKAREWSSAIGPLAHRVEPMEVRATSQPPRPASQGSIRAGISRTGTSVDAQGRREYVQFLLHLPRLKEALRVETSK